MLGMNAFVITFIRHLQDWGKKNKRAKPSWTSQNSYTTNLSAYNLTSKSLHLKFKFKLRAIFFFLNQSINRQDEE